MRVVLQTVLGSRFYSMRDEFPTGAWTADGFGAAWDQARRYFPGQAYFVAPGTYFMTHGFGPDGRLFMEIHDSAYLALCVANLRTFGSGTVPVEESRETADPGDKVGRLEPYFRDAKRSTALRKTLGEGLYRELLDGLRQEDYHMLAGGLMHEGAHAGLDEARASRFQAGFAAGALPVQWDELRAFMTEIGYHAAYSRWAAKDISARWGTIGGRLQELEKLRKNATLNRVADRDRFEKARAGAWAEAALVRLRLREVWQSARRIEDLAAGFRRDYVRSGAPAHVNSGLSGLERDLLAFGASAAASIGATELSLRSLEELLDQWTAWADGARPFPPPVTDSRAVLSQARSVSWPDPAPVSAAAAALMKTASEALSKERAAA